MRKHLQGTTALALTAVLALSLGLAGQTSSVPQGPRPEQFKFAPLVFNPPKPADFRAVLSNGLVVYIGEDHEIPWFNASLLLRSGPFLEPKDKVGVDRMTPAVMRSGGTATMTGEQINERMEFLAGTVSATNLSIHVRHLDEGLKVWMDILTNPAFPEDKVRRERDQALVQVRNRNRNLSMVAMRTFTRLIYGDDSPMALEATEAGTSGITREDLAAWHKKYYGAANAILIVSGDFKKADMLKKLEAAFGKWRKAEKAVPPIPKVVQASKGGVYMVQPEVPANQGVIRIGHLGLMVDDPDYPAVDLMNYILGGGSFSSRITKVVRTDNGLAYSTSSNFSGGDLYPGTFSAFCQTKNSTVVFASQLMLDLIEGMKAGEVAQAELDFARTARVESFPATFASVGQTLGAFARLEQDKRPLDYYDKLRGRYEKVTLADLKRVAQKWLQTDKMVIMVAGNIDECKAGADKMLPNQATIDAMASKFGGRTIDGLAKKYGDGTVHVVPLR
ncbi:MAG: insulinase family protein [Candidatus Aminicenantes bacterium]|nr:insulinase family protein [Candidatus Aminicenantes bacterium]